MHIRLNKLPGRTVLDTTGVVLGRIKEPLVDMETWLIDTVRVRPTRQVAGELGLTWSWFNRPTMDIPTGIVQAASDTIILRVSLGELHDAMPRYVPDHDVASTPIH
jgi:sporulation protein YlmC with PRC-barrel domain